MIPHRGALLLVKRRSLVRRLSASRPSFVAPTGLRHLPRLCPHPRLYFRQRRARNGFPSPVASFWSCPTTTHANFAFQPLSDRAPLDIARLPLTPSASFSPSSPSSSRSALMLSAPDHRPLAVAIIAIRDVISILLIIFSYLTRNTRAPHFTPQHRLLCHMPYGIVLVRVRVPLRRRRSSGEFPRHLCTVRSYLCKINAAALSPCLSAMPCALAPPARTAAYSLPRIPPRAHAPHPATLATGHALVPVATMPLNPDVLALLRLEYPPRAGTEVESAEPPYPVRDLTNSSAAKT